MLEIKTFRVHAGSEKEGHPREIHVQAEAIEEALARFREEFPKDTVYRVENGVTFRYLGRS